MRTSPGPAPRLATDGYTLAEGVVTHPLLARFREITHTLPFDDAERRRGGLRNPFERLPGLRDVVEYAGLRDLAATLMNADDPRLVRAILFDKTPDANWSVPWHQDTTVAVADLAEPPRGPTPCWGPWSVKGGVVHVRPPAHVLEAMLTLRLHLDDCPETNGALMVLPGSHRHGFLGGVELENLRRLGKAEACGCRAGDILAMRPLLAHASARAREAPSTGVRRRRVLHVEWTTGPICPPVR